MAFKLFIDINIIVDLLDSERSGHSHAVKLIDEAEATRCICFVTESVLNTTAYLVRKDYNVASLTKMFFHLLTFIQLLPVYTKTYQFASHMAVNDIEDAVLYQTAIDNNLDYFVTSDVKDYKRIALPSLPVITTSELIKLIDNL
jgi:predicted nucleic acid-binding protein